MIGALFLALPAYLLTLALWYSGDPMGERDWTGRSRREKGVGGGPPIEVIRTSDGLEFGNAPIPTRARTPAEFMQHLVCFARLDGAYAPRSLYLRSKSFERFTMNGVDSKLRDETGGGPPDFALVLEAGTEASGSARGSLTFLKNFEPQLPHPPVLKRLAGPQEYVTCKDGAIRFPATIAAGDEYEMEFLPQRLFRADLKVATVPDDSPYLQVDPLDSKELRAVASDAAKEAAGLSDSQRVLAIAAHLEKTCTYSRRPSPVPQGESALVHFLTGNRQGHCQQISAGLVLLCRLQGIPARIAGGMVASREPRSGLYQFSDASFHAWAEILTESGWAICEVAPSRAQIEENGQPGCQLPDAGDLAAAVEKARAENQRQGGGTFEETGEMASEEAGPLGKGGNGATRVANKNWPGRKNAGAVRNSETLGAVSGDKDKMRRSLEEQKRRQAERDRRKQRFSIRKILLGIALLVVVFLVWRFNLVERIAAGILRWVAKAWKALFSKKEKTEVVDRKEALQAVDELSERLGASDTPSLEGTDVVRLFNRFVEVMEMVSAPLTWASRQEIETVAEYFARVGQRLSLDDDRQGFLAKTFGAALYGRKKIPPGEARRFRDELRRLLQDAKERM